MHCVTRVRVGPGRCGRRDDRDRHAALADYRVDFEVVNGDPAEADLKIVIKTT